MKKELNKLNTERTVLIAKEKVIQNTIADFKSEAMETSKKELSHNILQRNVRMNQKLNDAIMSSIKETDLTQPKDFLDGLYLGDYPLRKTFPDISGCISLKACARRFR